MISSWFDSTWGYKKNFTPLKFLVFIDDKEVWQSWSIASVLKTEGWETGPGVRIPQPPPNPMCYPELCRDFFWKVTQVGEGDSLLNC